MNITNTILYCNADSLKNHLNVDGVNVNGVTFTTGKFDKCFNFVDSLYRHIDYLMFTEDKTFIEYTMESYIYVNNYTNKSYNTIFSTNNYTTNTLYPYIDDTGRLSSYNSTYTIKSTEKVPINKWVHIVIQRDKNKNMSMFIDGIKCNLTQSIDNLDRHVLRFKEIKIGGYSSGENLNGCLDDLKISNYAKYSNNFIPPITPLGDSYYPNVLSSTERICTILNDLEVNKIELYINNVLDKTYNNLKANTITIHNYNLSLINANNTNIIKIIGYKEGKQYPIEFNYKYLPPLSTVSTYSTIILRVKDLIERQKEYNSILIKTLKEKGVTNDLNGYRYEELIEFVRLLPSLPKTITITKIESDIGGYLWYIKDDKGVLTDGVKGDLYIDGVKHTAQGTFYINGSSMRFNSLYEHMLVNKTVYIDFTTVGVRTEDCIVNNVLV